MLTDRRHRAVFLADELNSTDSLALTAPSERMFTSPKSCRHDSRDPERCRVDRVLGNDYNTVPSNYTVEQTPHILQQLPRGAANNSKSPGTESLELLLVNALALQRMQQHIRSTSGKVM